MLAGRDHLTARVVLRRYAAGEGRPASTKSTSSATAVPLARPGQVSQVIATLRSRITSAASIFAPSSGAADYERLAAYCDDRQAGSRAGADVRLERRSAGWRKQRLLLRTARDLLEPRPPRQRRLVPDLAGGDQFAALRHTAEADDHRRGILRCRRIQRRAAVRAEHLCASVAAFRHLHGAAGPASVVSGRRLPRLVVATCLRSPGGAP